MTIPMITMVLLTTISILVTVPISVIHPRDAGDVR
jgi:hypothetical protein